MRERSFARRRRSSRRHKAVVLTPTLAPPADLLGASVLLWPLATLLRVAQGEMRFAPDALEALAREVTARAQRPSGAKPKARKWLDVPAGTTWEQMVITFENTDAITIQGPGMPHEYQVEGDNALGVTSSIENTIRAHGRGVLIHQYSQQQLLTRIVISDDGAIVVATKTWCEYWAPIYNSAPAALKSAVDALHTVWRQYIQTSFAPELQSEYCYRYFRVLDVLLREIDGIETHSRDEVLPCPLFSI